MPFKDRLLSVPARETSGKRTSSKYDFQKDWALGELLRLHASGDNYCLIYEHHEDVLILDCPEHPTAAEFIQVKTKEDGNWTLGLLLRRKKAGDNLAPSILAKLYSNRLNFPDDNISLHFVSNALLSLNVKSAASTLGRTEILASDLEDEDKAKISKQLKEELGLASDPEYETITFFRVCELKIPGHLDAVTGKLANFLEARYPGRKFSVPTVYRALFNEIRLINDRDKPDNYEQFIATKAISRDRFEHMLKDCGIKHDLDADLRAIVDRLNTEQFPFGGLTKIERQWHRYEMDRMNQANLALQEARAAVTALVTPFVNSPLLQLTDILGHVLKVAEADARVPVALLGRDYVQAMILMEYMVAHED